MNDNPQWKNLYAPPRYRDSHEAILEILTDEAKRPNQIREELFEIYSIDYTLRTVREHLRDLLTLGWIRRILQKDADMRKRFYLRNRDII